uniref:Putative radical SAM superfamily protein n=1 Tax=viral metagenome TaxID=1070528 RepID=A0A6M3KEY9_9ZZZZ
MNVLDEYTSTGMKLLHHTDLIEEIKLRRRSTPVSLQLAPTSVCNLNCVFCSNTNRKSHESLGLEDVKVLLWNLYEIGLKTVEWTGGGDPLLWDHLEESVSFAEDLGMEQGLITNGLVLGKYDKDFFSPLMWIRVSMNGLDYIDEINIPDIPHTVLGFSYVMNEKTTEKSLLSLRNHVKKYNPSYVRIVPNCQATNEEQEINNLRYSQRVKMWGDPYFYQAKTFGTPKNCWWCYLKPFVLHDGWVYPCSSVVLNNTADRSFHEKFRWCRIEQLPLLYCEDMVPFNNEFCDKCVFKSQNDMIESLIHPTGMEYFI